ncbi:hypothetical protein ACWXWE_22955 [Pantoea ananatis]|uniref:hypothetical protein n=1 Tax=Pantoea ananas TaxID=553 RepID=UPI001E3E79CB|nr:hypothetical protein [Pantoea ananatis]
MMKSNTGKYAALLAGALLTLSVDSHATPQTETMTNTFRVTLGLPGSSIRKGRPVRSCRCLTRRAIPSWCSRP